MSTTSTITHNLPEFPYSPASDARRHLSALLSSSHFVTTVVSPPPLDPVPHRSSATQPLTVPWADREHNADPPHTPPINAETSSAEIAACPPAQCSNPSAFTEIPSVLIETTRLQSFNDSPPRRGFQSVRLKSSKQAQPPSQAYSFKQSPVLIGTGQEWMTRPSPRHRSAWRRFRRMGNRFVTPLRSMGLGFSSCMGGGTAVTFCEDLSAHDTSPGSSWYSSGEYPPDFIRAVLENNALFGKLAVE